MAASLARGINKGWLVGALQVNPVIVFPRRNLPYLRCFSSKHAPDPTDVDTVLKTDPSLVNAENAPQDFTTDCAVVYRDVITPAQADSLANDILKRMKRRRYEKGHWDAVITGYKELELPDLLFQESGEDEASVIWEMILKIRRHLEDHHLQHLAPSPVSWLPCHAIDLKAGGELNAHVDSVKFSGDLVAGLSLLSPSIMRLKLPKDDDDHTSSGKDDIGNSGHVDLYLPPCSLYALTGVGRFRYSHELLPDNSIFVSATPEGKEDISVKRDHRLSVIFRDTK